MDKLRSMEVFVTAVDTGSFTAAAEVFSISPVMVGKHIRFLETLLGARLLTRTARRQNLTEIGQQYLDRCRLILAQSSAAESGTETTRATPSGLLKINAPVSFGAQCVAPAMTDYLTRHPDVSLDLNLNDRVIDLIEEGYDVAIRIGTLNNSGLVARPLRPYKMMICAAPTYLAVAGRPMTPGDLTKHQCLDFMHWSKNNRWRLKDAPLSGSEFPLCRFRSNNGQALKMAALQGFGLIMQSETLLAEDVAAGRLVSLLEDFVPPARAMHIVYPRDRQATPKMTTCVEFLLERFA
jgi:DNA-binding transcriptional LysR family regulator